MSETNNQKIRLLKQCVEAIGYYRALDLDIAEQELGDSDSWSFVRGRLLKLWGDRGLAGRISEIIEREFTSSKPLTPTEFCDEK